MSHDAAPVDLAGLRARMREMGIEDTVEPMLSIYLEDAPGDMERLQAALAAGEPTAIESAAHAMKSAARTIGAGGFAELLRQMEDAARTGRLADVKSAADGVRREHDAVLAYLRASVSDRPGGA